MTKVKCVDPRINVEEVEEKPIEFTHYLSINNGWVGTEKKPKEYAYLIYLGKCKEDGDIFAAYVNGYIYIYKGHYNSGEI